MTGRVWASLAVATLVVAGSGCLVVSTEPLYGDADRVAPARVAGRWVDEDGDGLVVRRTGPAAFEARFFENGEGLGAPLEMHFVELGDALFWDLAATQPGGGDWYAHHLLPLHSFARVEVLDDELIVWLPAAEWWERGLGDGSLDLPYLDREPVVVTAPTPDLRRVVEVHAGVEAAFEAPLVFRRAPREEPRSRD